MPTRKKGNNLDRWEIALVKAMLFRGGYNDQDILAYFTRPTRSVNHRVIGEIRSGKKHKGVKAAEGEALDIFLTHWPDIDPQTGLHLQGDELLIKAREAMIAAVHTFNGAGLTFRTELFIVTSIIAWTYLLHAFYKREGVDYRHRTKGGHIAKTKAGAEKYWELAQCLSHKKCPLSEGAIRNLRFLLELRHEIEHRSTDRIDEAVSAKLQACCINFNAVIKSQFGRQYGLEKRLPIALQFVTFDTDQRTMLKGVDDLPPHIATMMDTFQAGLTEDQLGDLEYAYRVLFVPKTANRPGKADAAIEFVKAGSDEAIKTNRVFLKETDKKRFTATQIVEAMRAEGFPRFNTAAHTRLWQSLDAKNPSKRFGRQGDYKNTWIWYENWLDRVRAHCQEQGDLYQARS